MPEIWSDSAQEPQCPDKTQSTRGQGPPQRQWEQCQIGSLKLINIFKPELPTFHPPKSLPISCLLTPSFRMLSNSLLPDAQAKNLLVILESSHPTSHRPGNLVGATFRISSPNLLFATPKINSNLTADVCFSKSVLLSTWWS